MVPDTIQITVALADGPRSVRQIAMHLPSDCTVASALCASALLNNQPSDWVDSLQVAIRGRAIALDTRPADGDRVDVCRPLKVDPKVARRERFAQQGARGTGLFSKRRAGAKSGY